MNNSNSPSIIIAAGGTGGHIFPALAVATRLRELGYLVFWVGTANGMENQLIPQYNIPLQTITIAGVRKKGWRQLIKLPFMLLAAIYQSLRIIKQHKPSVVVSFGGYVSFPLSLAAKLRGVPLIIHEQNSVAGLTNRILAKIANQILVAYANVLPSRKTQLVGNPVRAEFFALETVENRYNAAQGGLRVLVLGGSLGAAIFNQTLPAVFAAVTNVKQIIHQVGNGCIESVTNAYRQLKVNAKVVKFIDDVAKVYSEVDLIICRSGALTVSEVCASGVAAIFVPYPHAVDDHQRYNALELVNAKAALMIIQQDFTQSRLIELVGSLTRNDCLNMGLAAKKFAISSSCEKIIEVIDGYI
jgi:UDP-N-acetylglucosamine--N-acetylmuramyl-(pentapeptide) pyrophosphoryl-undecaprenol N-acetylglucosamine transferase